MLSGPLQLRRPSPRLHLAGNARQLFAASLCLSLCTAVCLPQPTHAWTQSTITGVSASLTVQRDGLITVRLRTELTVRAGWLSTLELVGLNDDLVLDPAHPPLLTSDTGATHVPEVELPQGGTVQLSFPRRNRAPRKGHYSLTLTYTTQEPFREATRERADHTRLRWSLPAWENGLENVVLQVTAPRGTLPLTSQRPGSQLEVATQTAGNGTLLRFHRAKLPRMTSMELVLDVPTATLLPAVRAQTQEGAVMPPQPLIDGHSPLAGMGNRRETFMGTGLWCLLAILALAKLLLTHLRARTCGLRLSFLIPELNAPLRVLGVLACGLLGITALHAQPELSSLCGALLIALVLERRCTHLPQGESATPRPAQPAELAALRRQRWLERLDISSLMDVTCPAGLCLLGALLWLCISAIAVAPAPAPLLTFALLGSMLFFSGTRRMQGPHASDKAQILSALQKRLSRRPTQLLFYRDGLGTPVLDVRLTLQFSTAPRGLKHASLVVGELPWLGRRIATPCWMLVVERGSPAEQLVTEALPGTKAQYSEDKHLAAYLAVAGRVRDETETLYTWLETDQASQPSLAA